MKKPEVLVVPTGTANLASVIAGLARAGADAVVAADPGRVLDAERVVLPGVGALGAAMRKLSNSRLAEALATRVREGRPTLAVCLGLQILCESSAESPGVRGLGIIECRVEKFSGAVRVPQIGWNQVEARGCRLVESGYAYFANSYRVCEPPAGWSAAFSDHGGRFVAALERGRVLACQFHPELSGGWGLALIRRWLEQDRGALC